MFAFMHAGTQQVKSDTIAWPPCIIGETLMLHIPQRERIKMNVIALLVRGAAAAIIVYDITSADSLTRAKSWVKELQRQGSPNMIMALAGGDWSWLVWIDQPQLF